MSTHISLPAFTLSATCGRESLAVNPAMIPVVTPHTLGHVHIPMKAPAYPNEAILTVYRGRSYYVGGVHLFLIAGRWVLRAEDYGTTFYHDGETILRTFTEPGKTPRTPSSLDYYTAREIYSSSISPELPHKGKLDFARRLLAEFNAYYQENKDAIDAAIRESNAEQTREEVEALEAEIAKLEETLSAKRNLLAAMK